MTSFLIFLTLLSLLFLLSSWNKQVLGQFFISMFRNKPLVVSLLSLLLYPGTVVHELSHLIVAAITFTPVKGMKLIPEVVDGNTIRAGSVTIAHVDIFRRTLIGIAPLFVGLTALWAITTYLLPPFSFLYFIHNTLYFIQIIPNPLIQSLVALYIIVSISASMYSSRKDLEALIVFVPIMIVFGIIAYILGFQISWLAVLVVQMSGVFEVLSTVLLFPLAIHLFLLILLLLLRRTILHAV